MPFGRNAKLRTSRRTFRSSSVGRHQKRCMEIVSRGVGKFDYPRRSNPVFAKGGQSKKKKLNLSERTKRRGGRAKKGIKPKLNESR